MIFAFFAAFSTAFSDIYATTIAARHGIDGLFHRQLLPPLLPKVIFFARLMISQAFRWLMLRPRKCPQTKIKERHHHAERKEERENAADAGDIFLRRC